MRTHRILLSILLLSLAHFAIAQRTLTGTVNNAKGEPLIGASIVEKGTTNGAITDTDGKYSLKVSAKATTIVVSFVGHATEEATLTASNVVDIEMDEDANTLSEFVTTALNISRAKKSLGYTVQDISGDNLTYARDGNVANSLAGKIAGVQVLGQSGAKFGVPNIRVRGIITLKGGDPLYVVDGTPTDISQVNMDDVDNISVLKGPAATALYGNRAASGVVIITTKKAKSGESSFTINHSTTYDVVGNLPDYQNEYGGGYSQEWETFDHNPAVHPVEWKAFQGQKILTYAADESWGPKLDGTPHRSAFSWQQGDEFGKLTPFSPNPNNVRQFFESPLSNNTNFAFAKGSDQFSTRISYTHIGTNGIIPNASQGKDFISAKKTLNMTKQLSVNLNVNYTNTRTLNRPSDRYGSQGGTGTTDDLGILNASTLNGFNQTIGSFNQWFQRQLNMDDLKNYKNEDGTFRSWNIGGPSDAHPKYWDSPYTQVYENTNTETQERLFGDVGVTYKFTDHLKASVIARSDLDNLVNEGRIAAGTLNAGGNGAFSNLSATRKETNYEGLVSYDQHFDKISLSANAGANMRSNETKVFFQSTVGGLTTPGFYNIAASKDRPTVLNNTFESKVNSLYASAGLGYGDFVYLDLSARNDWASTLPKANNSYFYSSISASFVFSEFLPKTNWLSFGKIRAGFAQVGTDTDPYQTSSIFSTVTPFGSAPVQGIPTKLANENLKPGLSSSYEGGLDLRFWNNRIGVEFTAYRNENIDQIIQVPLSSTSGFTTALINAGNIRTQGLELHINVVPIKTPTFNWNFDINLDRSTSKVIKLAEGLTNYELGSTWRGLTINAREGEEWGLFVGRKIQIDAASGKRIVDDKGHYVFDLNKPLGSVLPSVKGGFANSLTYHNFVLRFNMDFIVGGKFFSVTRMFNAYSGLAAETAGTNELGKPKRDPVADGGGILLDAVTADGKPNNVRVETQELYEDKLFALHDNWIFDQTYLKLREVAVGYNFPTTKWLKTPFKSAYVGFVVRNPWLIYGAVGKGIDVSEAESYWTEGGQLPSVRSFGVNFKLGF
jgi:TonB-linked SusC/RagA family outer membrane protein